MNRSTIDLVLGHPPAAGERLGVILGRQSAIPSESTSTATPSSGHQASGLAMKVAAVVHRRVEQRHGQPGPGQQVLEVPFRGRPDPVSDVRQRLTEQGRPDVRPGRELGGKVLHLARPRCIASATMARTSRRLVRSRTASATARAGGRTTGPTPRSAPASGTSGADGRTPHRGVFAWRGSRRRRNSRRAPDVVAGQRGRAGDHAALTACSNAAISCWTIVGVPVAAT